MVNKKNLLTIDDDPSLLDTLKDIFEEKYNVISARNGKETQTSLKKHKIQVAILDLTLPDIDGLELLPAIQHEDIDVIVLTARDSIYDGVRAMKLGALDYLTKPFDVETLREVVAKAFERNADKKEIQCLRSTLSSNKTFIGDSPSTREILTLVKKVAATDATVLITGESGTGKELIAQVIHQHSHRSQHPFLAINCGAIPNTLVESELFGYERGAFTGAVQRKLGRFELADGGTLFLDEISSLPFEIQVKLLRVLQEGVIEHIGGAKLIPTDIRVIAATNKDLMELVKAGSFRADLYYRLNVYPILIPPLRERRGDIPKLVDYFLDKYSAKYHRKKPSLSPQAYESLLANDWPGNVREVENIVQRLVLIKENDEAITLNDLPKELAAPQKVGMQDKTLTHSVKSFERTVILDALKQAGGYRQKAAEILGIHRNTLLRHMKHLNISNDEVHAQN